MERSVYLITKEGRNFNEKGSQFITENLDKSFGPADDTFILSGPAYNKPSTLAGALEESKEQDAETHGETCIAISRDGGKNTTYMGCDLIDGTILALRDAKFAGKTSWEILMAITEGLGRSIDDKKQK